MVEMAIKPALQKDWEQLLGDELSSKSNPIITFDEWKRRRENADNWKCVITKMRPELSKSISNETVFYDKLISLDVFAKRAIETFKQKPGRSAQVSALLDALHKKPFQSFLSFCESLISTNQMHIVLDFLTPEIPASAGPQSTECDAVRGEVVTVQCVSYDWRKIIRKNFVSLTKVIDPDNGLISELRSRNVINEWSVDTFMDPKGVSNRVSRILDFLVAKRPDEDFAKFCAALESNNQGHVVRNLLTPGGRDGTDFDSSRNPHLFETNVQLDHAKLDSLLLSNWKDLITLNRNEMVDNLDVDEGLLNDLVKYGVINIHLYEVIKEETSQYARAEMLLNCLHRRSDYDFAKFRHALHKHKQAHVVDDYLLVHGAAAAAVKETNVISAPSKDSALSNGPAVDKLLAASLLIEESKPVMVTSVTSKYNTLSKPDCDPICNASASSLEFAQQASDPHRPGLVGCSSSEKEIDPRCRAEQIKIESDEDFSGPTKIDSVTIKPCDMNFYNDHKSTAYELTKNCRGKCYIINNEFFNGLSPRKGTKEDARNIRELFTQLHFAVEEFNDLTAELMQQKIVEISLDPSLSDDQCLVLFVLSHGTVRNIGGKMKDCIFGVDGKFLTPEQVLNPLTDRCCAHLKGKPRVVFFQACRGDNFDKTDCATLTHEGVEQDLREDPPAETDFAPDEAPSYSDFLIAYPTQSHYRSFRNTAYGSWYINALVKVFIRHAHCMGLCLMLNTLNGNVSRWASRTDSPTSSNKTQIANFVSNLRKSDLYFFPGVVLDV